MGLQSGDKKKGCGLLAFVIFSCISVSYGQSTVRQIQAILNPRLQRPGIVSYQLKTYLEARIPKTQVPSSAQAWTAKEQEIRQRLLNEVIFHGWPSEWINATPRFEDMGSLPSGKGYRVRKLRYEIVPGFWSTAILYEPANLHGRVPAILNVNGHVGAEGKAVEYKQKRCINYALRGIVALSLEWLDMGELDQKGNEHWYAADLDLVGANGVGLFYLAMRRGLDYLYDLPSVDRKRIGVTGLSGGGWQTIVLSSLDPRVNVAVVVAGFEGWRSLDPRLPRAVGDNEQEPTDMFKSEDYTTLTAMRAPRPTLLINDAEDDCCFRAALVKPYIYDEIKPFFRLYGKEGVFQFHENTDPSTHNYQIDNRQQSYRFFTQNFDLAVTPEEIPVDTEIKSYQDLVVGLPKDNLTILGLARKLAAQIQRPPIPTNETSKTTWAERERTKLSEVVRYKPVRVQQAWRVWNTKDKGVESISYLFDLDNGLSATGIWVKGITTPSGAPLTVVLNDQGKKAASEEVSYWVNRGQEVLALDLLFTGDSSTQGLPKTWAYAEMLATIGKRPLGMETAQLLAIVNWLKKSPPTQHVQIVTDGIRSQMVALISSALDPNLFGEVMVKNGMDSMGYLLEKPVAFQNAPDLFCLDLYKEFDLNRIAAMAGETRISDQSDDNISAK